MARFFTIANDATPQASADAFLPFEGYYLVGGGATVTLDTTNHRSGDGCLEFNSGVSSSLAYMTVAHGLWGAGRGYYWRFYMKWDNLPDSTVRLAYTYDSASATIAGVRLTSAGKLQLFNETGTPAQIGSDSSATITTGQWYRIELYTKTDTGAADEAGLYLDGTLVASATGLSLSDNQLYGAQYGWLNGPGASKVMYVDDIAVNDSTGATQNSYPGEGKVVYLKPAADSTRDSWTAGAGGTTNLYEAVNNLPPVGVADGSATNTSQIRNATTSATDDYEATMQTYTDVGIASIDTITLVQALAATGSGSATNGNGALQIVSNPAQASEDSKTIGSGAAVGTYGTNWDVERGTAQVGPSVTVGTAPVLRVGRRDTNAYTTEVCLMLIAVDYVPGTVSTQFFPLLGIGS